MDHQLLLGRDDQPSRPQRPPASRPNPRQPARYRLARTDPRQRHWRRRRLDRRNPAAPGYGSIGFLLGIFAAAGFIGLKEGTTPGRAKAAQRWEAGAVGEESTARILAPLAAHGWTVLNDRSIPGSASNLDHLVVGPAGQLVLIDSKQWSNKGGATVQTRGGRLVCGNYDRQKNVETLLWEAQRVQDELGVPVTPVMVVHGAKVAGGSLRVGRVRVTGPRGLVGSVTSAPVGLVAATVLARRAEVRFPVYVG